MLRRKIAAGVFAGLLALSGAACNDEGEGGDEGVDIEGEVEGEVEGDEGGEGDGEGGGE